MPCYRRARSYSRSSAHAKGQQIITAEHLEAAAQQLGVDGAVALDKLIARVVIDRLPLLSLLQKEPLEMQSSHLSFQEYFTVRALCAESCVHAVAHRSLARAWVTACQTIADSRLRDWSQATLSGRPWAFFVVVVQYTQARA
jgi:hypothetical protein